MRLPRVTKDCIEVVLVQFKDEAYRQKLFDSFVEENPLLANSAELFLQQLMSNGVDDNSLTQVGKFIALMYATLQNQAEADFLNQ